MRTILGWVGLWLPVYAGLVVSTRYVRPVLSVGHSLPGILYLCRALTATDFLPPHAIIYYHPPVRVQETVRRVAPQADLTRGWLKTVAAGAGDTVCWTAQTILVNGVVRGTLALLQVYPLTVPQTCQTLGAEEVLPLGTGGRSFDGRYTGTIRREEIADVCTALF